MNERIIDATIEETTTARIFKADKPVLAQIVSAIWSDTGEKPTQQEAIRATLTFWLNNQNSIGKMTPHDGNATISP